MRKKVYCGGEYREFELLPREKVEEIVADLIPEEIVREAFGVYVPGYRDGYVAVDLVTGSITAYSLAPNEELHPFNGVHGILYALDNKITPEGVAEPGEILTEEEFVEFEQFNGSIEEFALNKGISLEERFIEYLAYYFDSFSSILELNEELNKWYRD